MRSNFSKWILAVFVTILPACGGSGSISESDSIPGTVFTLSSVWGWIQTISGLDSAGNWSPLTPNALAIVATGASVNASSDLRFASASSLLQDEEDQANNGSLTIFISDISRVAVGTPYSFTNSGDTCSFTLGNAQYQNGVTTPEPVILGSKQQCVLTFTQLGTAEGQSFAGTVVVTIAAGASDPASAATGTLNVTLSGQFENQLLGMCDASVLHLGNTSCSGTPEIIAE